MHTYIHTYIHIHSATSGGPGEKVDGVGAWHLPRGTAPERTRENTVDENVEATVHQS